MWRLVRGSVGERGSGWGGSALIHERSCVQVGAEGCRCGCGGAAIREGGYGSGVGRVRICIAIFVEYPNKGYAEYYNAMRLRY